MDCLPDELIRAIFCEASTPPRATLDHNRVYSLEGNETWAAQPYQLAAVSNRWREISLATPAIWSYIPLLKRREDVMSLALIQLNLTRSGNQPLVIFLDTGVGRGHQLVATVLQLVVEQAHRWLRLHIKLDQWCPKALKAQVMQACSTCAMPMLEELTLETGNPSYQLASYEVTQLRDCPRLMRLTNNLGILSPTAILGTLKYLSLSLRDTSDASLWAALSMTPALEHLEVYFSDDDDNLDRASLAPEHDIHLPLLTSLAVFGYPPMSVPWAHRLRIPNFRTLTLSIESCHEIRGFYETLQSPNLHLILMSIDGNVDDELYSVDASALKGLCGVRTLEIFGFRLGLSDDGFFRALETDAQKDRTCWAAQFTQLVLRECCFSTEMIQGIANFVGMRTAAAAATSGVPPLHVQWINSLHSQDQKEPRWLDLAAAHATN